MSEWTVITVIVTLSGFIMAVAAPAVKLNTNLTRISAAVSTLEKEMERLRQSNKQAHDQIWEVNRALDKQLTDLRIEAAALEQAAKTPPAFRGGKSRGGLYRRGCGFSHRHQKGCPLHVC